MGKNSKDANSKVAQASAQAPVAPQPAAEASSEDNEQRFLAALQRMTGLTDLTEEGMRKAISGLSPEQRQQLISEGQGMKRDLLTKKEHSSQRALYFKEVNRSADIADMPVDQDGGFLSKKIATFMDKSSDELPLLFLLEALASCPYLIKAAISEARGAPGASASDLAEIEAALSLLKVPGWREGEGEGRPPFVRRNLLLLHAHMHRERLRALSLGEGTTVASTETVNKARRLLDMLLAYSLQVAWVKASLTVTELQGLLTNGLWDHRDDECHSHMKQKLSAVGLKMPKISVRAHASDVAPGEKVMLQVILTRSHALSAAEMEDYLRAARDEQQQGNESAPASPAKAVEQTEDDANDGKEGLAAAYGGEAAALGKEGWWLVVESLRDVPRLKASGMAQGEPMHNAMVGRQALSPSLDEPQWCADVAFEAPSTPGEYKVIVHIRSSSMIGVDARRKVSFQVRNALTKRSLPSSSSGTSTEPAETMEAMEAAEMQIAEMQADEDGRPQPVVEEGEEEAMAAEKEQEEEARAAKAAEGAPTPMEVQ